MKAWIYIFNIANVFWNSKSWTTSHIKKMYHEQLEGKICDFTVFSVIEIFRPLSNPL